MYRKFCICGLRLSDSRHKLHKFFIWYFKSLSNSPLQCPHIFIPICFVLWVLCWFKQFFLIKLFYDVIVNNLTATTAEQRVFLWLNIFSLYQEALYSHIFVIFWVWTLHVSFSLLRYKAHHNQYWRCIHVYECYSYLWPVVYHRLSNIHWDFPHYWTLSEIFHKFKKYHLLSPPPPPPPPPFFLFFVWLCSGYDIVGVCVYDGGSGYGVVGVYDGGSGYDGVGVYDNGSGYDGVGICVYDGGSIYDDVGGCVFFFYFIRLQKFSLS